MNSIVLCQPDESKGCSVCCGIFNHVDISRINLEQYLNDHGKAGDTNNTDESGVCFRSSGVRDVTSHICSYQRFISPKKPGCSLHPKYQGSDGRDRSLFGRKICDEYLCPAHKILTKVQKNALISSTEDWYAYSIAIIDPESFIWILNEVSLSNSDSLISAALRVHGDFLSEKDFPIFFYSLAEYNQNKHTFTISNNPREQAYIKTSIFNL